MIVITERQRSIIEKLIRRKDPITIQELSYAFSVSERTIRNDLSAVKTWLENFDITLFKKAHVGIWLDINQTQKQRVKSSLQPTSPDGKVYSKNERKKLILFELLKSIQPVRAKDLAERFNVSQTTVMKDLASLKKEMSNYKVRLISRTNHGYHISGYEIDIRKMLMHYVFGDDHRRKMLHDITENSSIAEEFEKIEKLYDLNDDIRLVDIQGIIQTVKAKYHFALSDNSFFSLLVHIAVAIDRLRKGRTIIQTPVESSKIQSKIEYEVAVNLMQMISEKYQVEFSSTEIAYIAIHFISSRIKLAEGQGDKIERMILDGVNCMTAELCKLCEITEENLDKCKNALISHLALTIQKMELNLPLSNPLMDLIHTQYNESFHLAKRLADLFEEETGIQLPNSEIGFIALYVEVYVDKKYQEKRLKALVVCTTGEGSSKILSKRLKESVKELIVLDTISAFDLDQRQELINRADIVISTIDLKNLDIPVIRISPIVTEVELRKLNAFMGRYYAGEKTSERLFEKESKTDLHKLKTKRSKSQLEDLHHENLVSQMHQSALVVTEVSRMMQELGHVMGVDVSVDLNTGVLLHLLMSVARWSEGQFYVEKNIEAIVKKYPQAFDIIRQTLSKIGGFYQIEVPDTEVASVLRYFE